MKNIHTSYVLKKSGKSLKFFLYLSAVKLKRTPGTKLAYILVYSHVLHWHFNAENVSARVRCKFCLTIACSKNA